MRKILIAGGDTTLLGTQKSFLEVRDFEVAVTASADDVMDLAQETRPDLILLDFEMEGLDAEEVCRRLKRSKATRQAAVMVLTGGEPGEIKRQCLLAGATTVVRKVERRDALLRNITAVLGLTHRLHVRTACVFRVGITDAGGLTEAVAQNISQSGLYLTARKILQSGAALRLSFLLPGAPERTEIVGEVVRIETLVGGLYGYGVQFLEADSATLQALKNFTARY